LARPHVTLTWQTLDPAGLNVPGAHAAAVALVDPAGHVYPAEHGPVQFALVDPPTPYRPAAHTTAVTGGRE
jgi:hypothetical protein